MAPQRKIVYSHQGQAVRLPPTPQSAHCRAATCHLLHLALGSAQVQAQRWRCQPIRWAATAPSRAIQVGQYTMSQKRTSRLPRPSVAWVPLHHRRCRMHRRTMKMKVVTPCPARTTTTTRALLSVVHASAYNTATTSPKSSSSDARSFCAAKSSGEKRRESRSTTSKTCSCPIGKYTSAAKYRRACPRVYTMPLDRVAIAGLSSAIRPILVFCRSRRVTCRAARRR